MAQALTIQGNDNKRILNQRIDAVKVITFLKDEKTKFTAFFTMNLISWI
jgi:hypothetical protein